MFCSFLPALAKMTDMSKNAKILAACLGMTTEGLGVKVELGPYTYVVVVISLDNPNAISTKFVVDGETPDALGYCLREPSKLFVSKTSPVDPENLTKVVHHVKVLQTWAKFHFVETKARKLLGRH